MPKPSPTRGRRTNRDMFLDKLKELSGKDNPLITNVILRDALKWGDEKYKEMKQQLLQEGVVVSGQGHGGKVGLVYSEETKPANLFISYSHEDKELKEKLTKHLMPLKKLGLVSHWHDQMIKPGDVWANEISKNLTSAKIILLLISIDFINSEYCYDIELEQAMELHRNGKAIVIPIILRPCMWHHAPFAKFQALPKENKAVTLWVNDDEAFANVAEGIKIAVNDFMTNEQ